MQFKIIQFLIVTLIILGIFVSRIAYSAENYSNPVYEETFQVQFAGKSINLGIGDPTVIFHNGKYYMYATGDNYRYNAYVSHDLVNWIKGPVVFESMENGVWAPDVFQDPIDKKFYLYYTANRNVGVAVSGEPDTTFKNKGLLIKDAIDAHMFFDEDGKYYLYYATYPSLNIFVQEMETPLIKKNTHPVKLLEPSEPWEMKHINVTEAPWLLKHMGTYYLIYSGGGSDSADYSIGYATSTSPTGPYTRYPNNPIIKKGNSTFGPGHSSVVKDKAEKLWMIYHQKYDAQKGWMRFIAIDPIWFDENGVLHGRATRNFIKPAPETSFVGK